MFKFLRTVAEALGRAGSKVMIACSRLSVSEDDRKSERATSGTLSRSQLIPLVARSLFSIVLSDREPGTG